MRETTLADVRPVPGFLSYTPLHGDYHLLTVWGVGGEGNGALACVFSVVNVESGREVERSAPLTEGNAKRARPEWLALVRELNAP